MSDYIDHITQVNMKRIEGEALDAIASMLNTQYATGVGFMERTDNTLVVEWVDDATTEFTLTVDHHNPFKGVSHA